MLKANKTMFRNVHKTQKHSLHKLHLGLQKTIVLSATKRYRKCNNYTFTPHNTCPHLWLVILKRKKQTLLNNIYWSGWNWMELSMTCHSNIQQGIMQQPNNGGTDHSTVKVANRIVHLFVVYAQQHCKTLRQVRLSFWVFNIRRTYF